MEQRLAVHDGASTAFGASPGLRALPAPLEGLHTPPRAGRGSSFSHGGWACMSLITQTRLRQAELAAFACDSRARGRRHSAQGRMLLSSRHLRGGVLGSVCWRRHNSPGTACCPLHPGTAPSCPSVTPSGVSP